MWFFTKVNRLIITILSIIGSTFFVYGQHEEIIEIQAEKVDDNSNFEIQEFYKKLDLYVNSIGKNTENSSLSLELMINDFIIFSEDGLIMKDLNYHSVESCKAKIIENFPKNILNVLKAKWIYVSLESHVNKRELTAILKFLKGNNIEYHFANDEELEKMIKR